MAVKSNNASSNYLVRTLYIWVCLAILTIPALAKSWRISDYQDTIVVTKDGKFELVKTTVPTVVPEA